MLGTWQSAACRSVAILALSLAGCGAHVNERPAKQAEGPRPDFVVLPPSRPLWLEAGEIADVQLPLEYNGSRSLRIKRVTASCGCSRPAITPRVLQPGVKPTLSVQLDARGMPQGLQTSSLTIETEDGESFPLKDAVKFEVRRDIAFDSPVIQLGQLTAGTDVLHSSDLVIQGRFPLARLTATASAPDIDVSFRETKHRPDGKADVTRCSMLVTMPTARRQEKIEESVDVTFKGFHGRDLVIRIPMTGKIVSPVRINPARGYLGLLQDQKPCTLRCQLEAAGGGELEVGAVEGPEWVDITHRFEKAAQGRTLVIEVRRMPNANGEGAGTMMLHILGTVAGTPFDLPYPCVFVSDKTGVGSEHAVPGLQKGG